VTPVFRALGAQQRRGGGPTGPRPTTATGGR
jgi:hypothetical protein